MEVCSCKPGDIKDCQQPSEAKKREDQQSTPLKKCRELWALLESILSWCAYFFLDPNEKGVPGLCLQVEIERRLFFEGESSS